jgi:hypothetical protein
MGQAGWRDRIGRPSIVLSSALVLAALVPAAIAAGPPGRLPARLSCPATEPSVVADSTARSLTAGAEVSARLTLDSNGIVTGRRLRLMGGTAPVDVSLPPESFVAEAVGDVIVYGYHDDARGSVVRALLGATGCDRLLARPPEIVRSAVLDRAGQRIYIHSVSRQGRRDLGITEIDISTSVQRRVLDPPPADDRFGITFATSLRWSIDGSSLAVTSCGASRCRTRVLDTATGAVETHAGDGHGDVIALTKTTLVAFDACEWAPCTLLAIERASGERRKLVLEALSARAATRDGRLVLGVETPAGYGEVRP